MPRIRLTCHPFSPSVIVRGIEVSVEIDSQGLLGLRYALDGDISRVRLPPIGEPRRADGLWQHTCFEVFVKSGDSRAYREFNFSPSMAWAAYAFSSYRKGKTVIDDAAPKIAMRRSNYRLELHASLPAALPLRLAVAAVIEEEDGRLSYWALTHPADKPNFHHSRSFTLEL